jgi:hypothetical protein
MIGIGIIICLLLGYICAELTKIHEHFHILDRRIADVTTTTKDFLGRDIEVIRTKGES